MMVSVMCLFITESIYVICTLNWAVLLLLPFDLFSCELCHRPLLDVST